MHDPLSWTGANIIAARIVGYWKTAGHDVKAEVVKSARSTTCYAVRSDLHNGLPRIKRQGEQS